MGNMLGRSPHKEQEGRHGTVVNVAVVGNTADGAKGGSLKAVKNLIRHVSSDYVLDNLSTGHNSAEALLAEVADEITGVDKKGNPVVLEEEIPDKRMVVIEEELSRLFQLGLRGGSTMSEIMRQFYDSPDRVNALSRKCKLKVTRPHVSILGHITPEGLRHSMQSVEAFNGFANRFMFIASKRTGSIPEPRTPNWKSGENEKLIEDLKSVVKTFRPHVECRDCKERHFEFSKEARFKWAEFYNELSRKSEGKSGMSGAIIARAKPTLLRLAIIYTALDNQSLIKPQHLEAAKALWDYSTASALWAFGENSGNADADKILRYLKRQGDTGATRSQIRLQVFSNHKPAAELTEALSYLHTSRFARWVKDGREWTWFAE
jgi:hypothetical protein